MMKLFDFHSDTGYAVMKHRNLGKYDSITQVQLPKRSAGGFSWVCMASYFEGTETWDDMKTMVNAVHEECALCSDVKLVKTKKDLHTDHALHAICTIEGMCGIREDVIEKIDWLYEHDIKIASLAWNEENALATGVRGNEKRGLTKQGIDVIKRMSKHRMIVDVSHANEQTFWDIMQYSDGPVMATHSNARALCDHPRNLKDEQLIEIAKRGGIIGVVCAGAFVAKERSEQTIANLVSHMVYLKQLIGTEHIALGLDFMDDYDGCEETMLLDLKEPSSAQAIIEEMRKQQFSEKEINMIAYENAIAFISKWI